MSNPDDLTTQTRNQELHTEPIELALEEIKNIIQANGQATIKDNIFQKDKPLSLEDSENIQKHIPLLVEGLKHQPTAIQCTRLLTKLILTESVSDEHLEELKISDLCIQSCSQIADQVLAPNFENIGVDEASEIVGLYSHIFSICIQGKDQQNVKLISRNFENLMPFIDRLIATNEQSSKKTLRLAFRMMLEVEDFENITRRIEDLMIKQIELGDIDTIRILTGFLPIFKDNRMIQRRLIEVIRDGISKRFGIDGYRFVDEWSKTYGLNDIDLRSSIDSHLNRMFNLENKYIGSVKYLFEEYGIVNFGRYSNQMLLQQYEQREVFEDGHTVLIYPRTDYNGAFNYNTVSENLRATLGLNVKIYECSGLAEMDRLLEKNEKRHGKIGISILGGHGSENSINFGHHGSEISLNTSDLITKLDGQNVPTEFGKRFASRFTQDGTVFLESCSTAGGTGGIALALSLLGLRVIGPTAPSSVYNLYPKRVNNQVRFYPTYTTKERVIIPHKIFKNGEDITAIEEVWEN